MPKILIVDDADAQRFQLKQLLVSAGHAVVEAFDGYDGLEKINQNSDIALIICDVNMPNMDGLTMCSKLPDSMKTKGVPIFMLTTESTAELKEAGKKVGVRAWITKPYGPDKLLLAISKLTGA